MNGMLLAMILFAGVGQANDAKLDTGYLTAVTPGAKKSPPEPYVPKEGDLIFYDDHNLFWTVLFLWAGTGPPLHVGIVVKNDDGNLAVLEAGPDDTIWVNILELGPRLRQFQKDYSGTISIR